MTAAVVKRFTATEEQVFRVMTRVEDRIVQLAKPWAHVIEQLLPELPRLPLADQVPTPAEIVGASFNLLDKLVANEREFAERLLEALQMSEPKSVATSPKGAVSVKAESEAKAS